MIYKPDWFTLQELVCPHTYYRYGEMAWQFRDTKQSVLLDYVRAKLGSVSINNWYSYRESDYIKFIAEKARAKLPIIASELPSAPVGLDDESGLRCNICSIYLEKTNNGVIYISAHGLGKGDDFHVQGRTAEEVRQYLIKNKDKIPHPIRLEVGVPWVHMDCEEDINGQKVMLFNP
jgi:hypothetical protein